MSFFFYDIWHEKKFVLINEFFLSMISAIFSFVAIYVGIDTPNNFFLAIGLLDAFLFISIVLMHYGRRTKQFGMYWPFFVLMGAKVIELLICFMVLYPITLFLWVFPYALKMEQSSIDSLRLPTLTLMAFVGIWLFAYIRGLVVIVCSRQVFMNEERKERSIHLVLI